MTSLGGVWIPEDVLNSIFEETAPKALKSALPLPHLSPLLLGHVCAEWRTISQRNPTLWGMVFLSDVRDDEWPWWTERWCEAASAGPSGLRCSAQAQYWLDRCGEAGLSLAFNAYPTEIAEAFFEVVVKGNLHRFRALDLQGLPFASVSELMDSKTSLPLLGSLAISDLGSGEGLSPQTFGGWVGLSASPALRRVHLESIHEYWGDLPANIPWQQLTHVSFASQVEGDLFYQFLKVCKRLESLAVCIQGTRSRPAMATSSCPENVISLPYLRHLDVRFGWCSTISVFDFLEIPLLRSLTLRTRFPAKDFIRSLQVPSNPSRDRLFAQLSHLSSFTIFIPPRLRDDRDMFIPSETILQLLRHSRNLTSLSISSQVRGWDTLFASLSNENDPVLPNLLRLTLCLSSFGTCDLSPAKLVEMALTRSGLARSGLESDVNKPFKPAEITLHVTSQPLVDELGLGRVGTSDILEAYASLKGMEGPANPPFRIVEDDSMAGNRCIGLGDRWVGAGHE